MTPHPCTTATATCTCTCTSTTTTSCMSSCYYTSFPLLHIISLEVILLVYDYCAIMVRHSSTSSRSMYKHSKCRVTPPPFQLFLFTRPDATSTKTASNGATQTAAPIQTMTTKWAGRKQPLDLLYLRAIKSCPPLT